jgi:transposase-like protein
MTLFAQAGDFCPNKACPDYGKLQNEQSQGNIRKYGKTRNGTQRYQCKRCRETFTATKGTLFYRRRTPMKDILESLALVTEGMRISSISRVKGHKEDTILAWLREAAQHVEMVEALLLANYQLDRGQLDALWAFVGNKGEKKVTRRQMKVANSGGQP